MQKPVQERVVNGNGRPPLHPQYEVPVEQPDQVLIIPQQRSQSRQQMPVNPHMPRMPAISESSYIGMQQLQLAFQALPMILPIAMSTPMHFLNSVSEKMDDLTTYLEGHEEAEGYVEFNF
jgi:hypothetical protein